MSRLIPVRSEPAGDTPPFERVAIVGFGLIGGSIALAMRRRWRTGLIIAVDRKPVLESATRVHAADVAGDDLVMAADADLVVLAAPVRQNIEILGQLAEYVPATALVTDVGSTKRAMLDAARRLPARLRFVGGHPLAGAATGGFDGARPDLFDGRPWILTPEDGAQDPGPLEAWIAALGASPRRMTAEAHDRLLAALSHLPQLAASALMRVVGEQAGEEGLALAGRGLRDTTRLASSPDEIWRDIVLTNADPIEEALDALIRQLEALRNDLRDGGELERVFAAARTWKRVLEGAGPPDSSSD